MENPKELRVRVTSDCTGRKRSGMYGIYLGEFVYPHTDRPARGHLDGNPLIQLDDGSYIWGQECWWHEVKPGDPELTVEQEQEKLGDFLSDPKKMTVQAIKHWESLSPDEQNQVVQRIAGQYTDQEK